MKIYREIPKMFTTWLYYVEFYAKRQVRFITAGEIK